MSKLRPDECRLSSAPALPDDTVLFLVRDAVARRRSLLRGRLNGRKGGHCAMGWFWIDNPGATVNTTLIDEVATVNDSLPATATPQERWKKVMSWLRWKVRVLATVKAKP